MIGQDDPPPDAPCWPHDRWISPTILNNYRNCPKRARLQYVDRVAQPWQFRPHLTKGRVAHLALKRIVDALARNQPPIDIPEIEHMARLHLPLREFPSPEEYHASVRDVVRWVAYGRDYLIRIPGAEWLLVEKNQTRTWPIFGRQIPYTLMARPDVLIQRVDDDGALLIEIIDYKTGAIRPEDEPPVMMRFVAWNLLHDVMGNPSAARVRFTYLWLDHAESTHIDLSVEYCNTIWPDIIRQASTLVTETDWPAMPSRLCRYCPYFENICQETIPLDDSFGP